MMDIEIKERDAGEVEARGFVLEREDSNWILYPEPALKSCCRKGELKQGLELSGNIPRDCKGHCVTLLGHLEGNKLNVSSTDPSGLSLWPLVIFLLLVPFWKYLNRKSLHKFSSLFFSNIF